MKSIYIHIPFCKKICTYCDFCKFIYNDEWASKYLNALEEEIKTHYENNLIDTLYIGGGTPSALSKTNLEKLFSIIKTIKLEEKYEFTFECNIDDISKELLEILKQNKVNRISVGVQSFNKKKLHFLGRNHNKKQIKEKIKLIKSYGFENINVDLIYALPGETLFSLKKDISNLLKLEVPHISTYSLIIEPGTKLKIDKVKPIDEELDYKMYKTICNKLSKKGYKHYEVSNFAKPGYESVHNLRYWENEEYYGFGLGAHGYINGVRYENTRNLNKYLEKNYKLNELFLSNKENMENEIILGLRKLDGINIKNFNQKYKKDIYQVFKIQEALDKKILILDKDNIKVPENKIYILNEIINFII